MSKERAKHYYSIITGKMPDELKAQNIKRIAEISSTMKVLKDGKIWDKREQNKSLLLDLLIGALLLCFPAHSKAQSDTLVYGKPAQVIWDSLHKVGKHKRFKTGWHTTQTLAKYGIVADFDGRAWVKRKDIINQIKNK